MSKQYLWCEHTEQYSTIALEGTNDANPKYTANEVVWEYQPSEHEMATT
jgi:hypothetical protein